MNLQSLRPATDFAQRFGAKALVFGPAGSGKTPVINSAPRPVLLACEPGMLSMRGSRVPTFQAFTPKLIDEFFDWFFRSSERKNFDTLAVDSATQMAEIYLEEAEKSNKHGLAAYGEANRNTLKHLQTLYFTENCHTYLIAKQEILADGLKRPYFPGKELPVKLPHMYDCILHLDTHAIPSVGQHKSFQCEPTYDIHARNRTGTLSMFEQPNFSQIVTKAMQ